MEEYPKYGQPFEPREFYHIYNSAVGKEKLFTSADNYKYFLDRFHFYTREVMSVYSFCLLGNHFHFSVKINDSSDNNEASEQLRKFFISYAKSYNNQECRSGSLFNKHLKRVKIKSDEQLIWTLYYIHRNPVHHKITADYKNYSWSSYRVLVSGKPTKLKREAVLELFPGTDGFMKFHDKNIEEDILNKKFTFWSLNRHGISIQSIHHLQFPYPDSSHSLAQPILEILCLTWLNPYP
ncbi:MAG: hypothetical protein WEA58_13280 [Balneolaceae bacterium]